MNNFFAFLNKSTNNAGRSETAVVAELTERNRKFEAFLVEKLADLERKIIPVDPTPPDDDLPAPADAPAWDAAADALLTGSLLGAPRPDSPPPPDDGWLAGFDDDDPPDTGSTLPADDGGKGVWD